MDLQWQFDFDRRLRCHLDSFTVQKRRFAPRGIAGQHVKNETAELGEGLAVSHTLDKGRGNWGGVPYLLLLI